MHAVASIGVGSVKSVCIETERRRYERVEEPVCTWLSFRTDSAAYGTLTVDIGMEGARFETHRHVQVGEHTIINLQLPSNSIECKGRVCWTCRGEDGLFSFGVRFLDLREAEHDWLGRHLNQCVLA